MLKPSISNEETITPIIPAVNTLRINYYDPYGTKVGDYRSTLPNENVAIESDRLKEIIDLNIPQDYQIIPYFTYPEFDITDDNITEEIKVAVKEIDLDN